MCLFFFWGGGAGFWGGSPHSGVPFGDLKVSVSLLGVPFWGPPFPIDVQLGGGPSWGSSPRWGGVSPLNSPLILGGGHTLTRSLPLFLGSLSGTPIGASVLGSPLSHAPPFRGHFWGGGFSAWGGGHLPIFGSPLGSPHGGGGGVTPAGSLPPLWGLFSGVLGDLFWGSP